ncbi:hypothetical protein BDQ17DRAFT_1328112 [Cyathus striatus]|nr:hypothetical protein BDQ17DRAFT_1328112 [Cyathus striatus]
MSSTWYLVVLSSSMSSSHEWETMSSSYGHRRHNLFAMFNLYKLLASAHSDTTKRAADSVGVLSSFRRITAPVENSGLYRTSDSQYKVLYYIMYDMSTSSTTYYVLIVAIAVTNSYKINVSYNISLVVDCNRNSEYTEASNPEKEDVLGEPLYFPS